MGRLLNVAAPRSPAANADVLEARDADADALTRCVELDVSRVKRAVAQTRPGAARPTLNPGMGVILFAR
jgi:hypothetical protein